jgi:hypothetical protein
VGWLGARIHRISLLRLPMMVQCGFSTLGALALCECPHVLPLHLLLLTLLFRPRYTLRAHGGGSVIHKGLCVAWSGSSIASGGSDSQLKAFALSGLVGK